jgi:hypothetical protein
VAAFDALGVTARARTVSTGRGVGDLRWLVLATLPLHAFLSGLGSTLAQEASQGVKRLVGQLLGARSEAASTPPVVVLQDAATACRSCWRPTCPPLPTRRCSLTCRRSTRDRCTTTDRAAGGARNWTKDTVTTHRARIPNRH